MNLKKKEKRNIMSKVLSKIKGAGEGWKELSEAAKSRRNYKDISKFKKKYDKVTAKINERKDIRSKMDKRNPDYLYEDDSEWYVQNQLEKKKKKMLSKWSEKQNRRR